MPASPPTKFAILSLHSHADRSYLGDRELSVLSGELRAEGVACDVVASVVEPDAPGAALDALVQALGPYDVVLYQRIFSREIATELRRRLRSHTLVAILGEHVFDPDADFVLAAPSTDLVLGLLEHLSTGAALPAGARPAGQPSAGQPERPKQRAFAANLAPLWVGPRPAHADYFVLHGNAGCPYQRDARENPEFSAVAMPDGVGRGCGFCAAGNSYEALPLDAALARVLAQLRYVLEHAPHVQRLVLKDQNPFAYLEQLFESAISENLRPFTLLLETRADWFLRARSRVERIAKRLRGSRHRLAPYLVGIENFSPLELARMNKGISVDESVEFLNWLRRLQGRYPDVIDLSQSAFGFVLLTPWTTFRDLELNLDGIVRTRLNELRGELLLSRVRLYSDNALYYLAQRDGLLTERFDDESEDASARYGYFPAAPWRFQDRRVACFSKLARAAHAELGGRDEPKLFAALLDALEFAEDPDAVQLGDVLARFRDSGEPSQSGSGRTVQVHLHGGCRLSCLVCDCHDAAGRAPPEVALGAGGDRAVLRGNTEPGDELLAAIELARKRGFSQIVVRTPAITYAEPESAPWLAQAGVDRVVVPLFSHRAEVHDRITGRRGSLARSLAGMRALERSGVGLEVEVPLLSPTLRHLAPLFDLLERAVSSIHCVHLFMPESQRAAALLPRMDQVAQYLPQLLRRLRNSEVQVSIVPSAGIPLCAVRGEPALTEWFAPQPEMASPQAVCTTCAQRPRCAGPPAHYRARYGQAGLEPFAERPPKARKRLRARNARLGGAVELMVLRPTVHCNQDCVFCSANQTSKNAYEDPRKILKAIVRAAARGVPHLSFSGGEPTLAKELPDYVRAARRLGIPKVEIVTNGVLLDRPGKVQQLIDAGLTHAFVSLHATAEAGSRLLTQKDGDFERTCTAIVELSAGGVRTAVNHVITARNMHGLERFVRMVHERFGPSVMTSFAFLTPEYRALDDLTLLPRYQDVRPHLRRAVHRAVQLGQPVSIGSRQGIPPCQLGEVTAWSDVLWIQNAALSEDLEHKVRGPDCDACRFSDVCTGVWHPYAERYGFSELSPVAGPKLSADAAQHITRALEALPFGVPRSFEDVPHELRVPELEREGAELLQRPESVAPSPPRRLPMLKDSEQRPLRLGVVGVGSRARAVVRAASEVTELALDSVASPSERRPTEFGHIATYRDLVTLLNERRPDAVFLATPTATHAALARECLQRGVPLLVEKPLASGPIQARALAAAAQESGVVAMAAHQLALLPGIAALASAPGSHLFVRWQMQSTAPDAPRRWQRQSLLQQLHHGMEVVIQVFGDRPLLVEQVQFSGAGRPEKIRARLVLGDNVADLSLDYSAGQDELEVSRGQTRVVRSSTGVTVVQGERVERHRGSDRAGVLRAFAQSVRSGTSRVPLTYAAATLEATRALLDALERHGAPLRPESEPRRVASRGFREAP